jgi:cytidylate kinase
MKKTMEDVDYSPGFYTKNQSSASEMANQYINDWEESHQTKEQIEIFPTICLSRKIGVGAVEIADILARRIGYRTVDRQIMERITKETEYSKKISAIFAQRFPGKINTFLSRIFNEKPFPDNEYNRHLFATMFSIAYLQPTIFVGWGTHLVLPRERVFAVRFVCSKAYRINRLTQILLVDAEKIEGMLEQLDKKQRDFFRNVYGVEEASSSEFDMVINCSYVSKPEIAADIIEKNFKRRFAYEI